MPPCEHWLSRFTDAQVAADPRLALAAAGTQLAHGQGHLAEHWLDAVAASCPDADVAGAVAALRGRAGPRRTASACATMPSRRPRCWRPTVPCQALCGLLRGVAEHLHGDPEAARRALEAAARRAAVSAPHVHALCLAQLALIALDDNDWELAASLATRARSQVARYGLNRYPTSALALAVSALVRAQRGRVGEAHDDAVEAAELVEQLTDLAPWYEARGADRARAHRAAAERCQPRAGATRRRPPDRRVRSPRRRCSRRWLHAAEADLETFASAACQAPSSLTTAELRILHFLPTHLSFREIAERTFVSANTVKTQANAVYRKLDVRSRSEAVTRARELGLVDD